MKHLYRFQYFTHINSPFLHQTRDLSIVVELLEFLFAMGYRYVDAFLNYPKTKEVDTVPFTFEKGDLMLMTTRPPLSDIPGVHKRVIHKNGHVLEQAMLVQIKRCFRTLSRQRLTLHPNIAAKLPLKYCTRGLISFYVNQSNRNKSAGYRQVSEYDVAKDWIDWLSFSNTPRSCAFLIFFPAQGILPKMLHVFGIGGQEGLLFARILKNELWEKLNLDLDGPARFVMVELDVTVPKAPLSHQFVSELNYDVILDTTI